MAKKVLIISTSLRGGRYYGKGKGCGGHCLCNTNLLL